MCQCMLESLMRGSDALQPTQTQNQDQGVLGPAVHLQPMHQQHGENSKCRVREQGDGAVEEHQDNYNLDVHTISIQALVPEVCYWCALCQRNCKEQNSE